jgi:hypothetical protein
MHAHPGPYLPRSIARSPPPPPTTTSRWRMQQHCTQRGICADANAGLPLLLWLTIASYYHGVFTPQRHTRASVVVASRWLTPPPFPCSCHCMAEETTRRRRRRRDGRQCRPCRALGAVHRSALSQPFNRYVLVVSHDTHCSARDAACVRLDSRPFVCGCAHLPSYFEVLVHTKVHPFDVLMRMSDALISARRPTKQERQTRPKRTMGVLLPSTATAR